MSKVQFVVVDVTYGNVHVNASDAKSAGAAGLEYEHNFGMVAMVLTPENAIKVGEALIAAAKNEQEKENGEVCKAEQYNFEDDEEEEDEDGEE